VGLPANLRQAIRLGDEQPATLDTPLSGDVEEFRRQLQGRLHEEDAGRRRLGASGRGTETGAGCTAGSVRSRNAKPLSAASLRLDTRSGRESRGNRSTLHVDGYKRGRDSPTPTPWPPGLARNETRS